MKFDGARWVLFGPILADDHKTKLEPVPGEAHRRGP
jgi:hypothetical protein